MLSINSAASLLEFLLREEYILVDYGVVLAKHQLPRCVLDVLLPDVGEASAGRGDQLEKHLRLNYEVSMKRKEIGIKIFGGYGRPYLSLERLCMRVVVVLPSSFSPFVV